MGDSFYEYLLKVWIQGGKKETFLREMYDKAIDGMTNELLVKSSPSKYLYIANLNGNRIEKKMDHLVAFVPGLLALGAYTKPDSKNAKRDLKNAKALMYTFFQMYNTTASKLSPEYSSFKGNNDMQIENIKYYYLRPEMVESLFILHQLTGDAQYREWGYQVFKTIEQKCKAQYGYASYEDVGNPNSKLMDKMESFTLSETFKYFYLLFSSETIIDFDREVLTSEAHPLPVFN